jgi:hypothetical protein
MPLGSYSNGANPTGENEMIDWKSIPKYKIECQYLNTAFDIRDAFKNKGISKYVYRINYKGVVLKYGMSCERFKSKDPGDRLYRQIGHSESWGPQRIDGSSGSDWRIIEEDYNKLYGTKIDRMSISIQVYDFTHYDFVSTDPRKEVYFAEQELIELYRDIVGEKPIGNINDDPLYRKKGYIPKKTFDANFEFSI